MPRSLAVLITVCATLGCSSGQNTECRWPDEPPRILNLGVDADAQHLSRDIELVEELSVRFADASPLGPGPEKQRYKTERCYEPLMAALVSRHGVTMPDVLAAQSHLGERGLNLAVNGPVAVFFIGITFVALRWIRRRFSRDEWRPAAVATMLAGFGVCGMTVGAGRVWQMLSETIRVGNGHLGGQRGLRLPWVQHSGEYFIMLIGAFALIAFLPIVFGACRSRARRNAANLPSCW